MEKQLRTMRILWAALLASTGMYTAMLASKVITPPAAAERPPLLLPFAALSCALAVVSFVLPKFAHRQAALRSNLQIRGEPVPEVFAAGYRQAAPERKVFADPAAARQRAAFCFQTPFILGLALSEAIALNGFVLGFLGFEPIVWAPFMAAGAVLIAMRFPTEARVVAPFEAALGASIPGRDA